MAQRQRRAVHRSAGAVTCVATALCAWCQSLLSSAGLAHILSLVCFLAQVILINYFLVQYLSTTVLLTISVDLPLFLHLVWFWRVESTYRAAPTQWFCYCWVHAAKVVVLFCRVMPRLASAAPAEDGLRATDFSINSAYFQDLFSPTMLANLLLITPVFYALLMFRTSKAIFGSLSKRVTVDLIMHYDMLWHVVIDMVDQVGSEALEKHRHSLVMIQTAVPFLLFFSMVMQAQAFPGVVTDKWTIPVDESAISECESEPAQELSGRDSWRRTETGSSSAIRTRDARSQPAVSFAPGSEMVRDLRGLPSQESGSGVSDRTSNVVHKKTTVNGLGNDRTYLERQERARRRRLQGVMNLIQRQNIIIARKRSAIASIFLIDVPFLAIRIWVWALLQHTYFPGLGIKNGLCIVLNVMQYTLVAVASKESFKRINRELAEYIVRFQAKTLKEADHTAATHEEGEIMAEVQTLASPGQKVQDSPLMSASKDQEKMKQALRRVSRESSRGVGVCVYICALTIAFVGGFVLAKGETVVTLFVAWVKEAVAHPDG
ncbi:unnamed protein product [Effrenium voratum]|uniref:Uncharacterized protein n=1 Tax=Effrenium voratum TaxID=2562239 RepID=A0AA36I0S4_9DINO|nr:unnamed protein product [Effrenium voratum]CAJ1378009.1 unnamed protein product [Effrenium voratum]